MLKLIFAHRQRGRQNDDAAALIRLHGRFQRRFNADDDQIRIRAAQLPYRSLLPKKTDNLLVAGRCISADRKTLGQIRLQSYCLMMGQAAGTAAAMAADGQESRSVNAQALQRELLKGGAYLREELR